MTDLNRPQPPQRPRLKRTIETVETPDGDIHLMRAAGEDVRIGNVDDHGRRLIAALDGTRSIAELEAEFGASAVRETVAQMRTLSLLEDAANEDEIPGVDRERFDRQLRYFSDVAVDASPSPAECQQRLREATVAVLGAGGLGGRAAMDLAAMGVGAIRIVDGDRVDMSNLNRQIQYTEADIGRPKAEVMAERLAAFNSDIRVSAICKRLGSQEEIATFIRGANFVVGSADWPAFVIEHWCNAACFESGVPYITMSQLPPFVRVGPLYAPGRTGCFQCQSMRYRREYPLMEIAVEQRRAVESPAATLSSTSGAIAGLVSMEIMHFITGLVEPASLGVGLMFDLRTMTVEREPVVQEKECPICGPRGVLPAGQRETSPPPQRARALSRSQPQ